MPFGVIEMGVGELDRGEPAEVVVANAARKAGAGAERAGADSVVVGCDTDVVADGRVLGQPADAEGARRRLAELAGVEHEVLSGIAVAHRGDLSTGLERTRVRFARLTESEIERYVATGEWRGRAGGYAIQGLGSALIERVEGDLASVIGLPVRLLTELLEALPRR